MKALPLLLAALLLPASATLAQTVLPSGAVAPTGTSTPGTVPGSQPVVTPNMRNAGSPRGKARDAKIPGLSRHEERQLRKMAKARPEADKPRKN